MRIGFTSIYAWRPHSEHLYYLAGLARQAGHETSFLACDADLPSCYARELRPQRPDWVHCTACRIGGIRSYTGAGVSSIGSLHADPATTPAQAKQWSHSSASTLGRFESNLEFAGKEFAAIAARLEPAARLAYAAARRWIDRERLEAVCVFNGRVDATRGVLEAALDAGVRVVSAERTWFGHGLQLLPDESCLGLRSIDRMMSAWRSHPLAREQALRAASHVAARFLRRNATEWRAYNVSSTVAPWPVSGGRYRVLLVPSSRNEVWGHPDWQAQWPDLSGAFDALIDHLGLHGSDLVLRCHPNWGERIGPRDGGLSERYFTEWARRRGIHVIRSRDTTSTLGLVEQADAVVVCGGSAALEAGILGRQVIAVSPSIYQQAGFQSSAYTPQQLAVLSLLVDRDPAARAAEAARIARQTLRFCHTMVYRVAQYVRYVRCLTPTHYEYLEGADPARLMALLRTGQLEPDDGAHANDHTEEDEVLALVRAREWEALFGSAPLHKHAVARCNVRRRWIFRPLDRLRETMPRGDA